MYFNVFKDLDVSYKFSFEDTDTEPIKKVLLNTFRQVFRSSLVKAKNELESLTETIKAIDGIDIGADIDVAEIEHFLLNILETQKSFSKDIKEAFLALDILRKYK